jgi:Right handed beta helix region
MPEHIYISRVFGTGNYRHGASVIGGRKIFFDGCQFASNTGDILSCGMDIEPDTGLVAQDINITNCRFDSNSSGGLYVQNGLGTTSRIRVINCYATSNVGFGFDFANATDIQATNLYSRGNGSFGFFSLACSPMSLDNCTAVSNTTNGFWIVGGASVGLSNCRSVGNTSSGYLLTRDSSVATGQMVLSNCDADSNGNRGMYLSYATDVVITGGSITRSANDGLDISNSCNCTITGMEIAGNITSGDLNGDNVIIEGASHYNHLSVNTVRQSRRFFHGQATAGASTTITLPATCLADDDVYNGYTIRILSGTGNGQSKTITDFVGSTRVVTVNSSWSVTPDNTSVVEIANATRPRYGIRINSGCTGNKITDNDLYYAGGSAALSDAGASTVTTSANRES